MYRPSLLVWASAHADTNSNRYRDSDINADQHCHADQHFDSDLHRNCDEHGNVDCNAHRHADTEADSY